jgi:hypothetical protein
MTHGHPLFMRHLANLFFTPIDDVTPPITMAPATPVRGATVTAHCHKPDWRQTRRALATNLTQGDCSTYVRRKIVRHTRLVVQFAGHALDLVVTHGYASLHQAGPEVEGFPGAASGLFHAPMSS